MIADASADPIYFDDVDLGDEVGPVVREVTDDQVIEFTQVWGRETGPTRFTSPEKARSEGLPEAIVPGAMNIAIMSPADNRLVAHRAARQARRRLSKPGAAQPSPDAARHDNRQGRGGRLPPDRVRRYDGERRRRGSRDRQSDRSAAGEGRVGASAYRIGYRPAGTMCCGLPQNPAAVEREFQDFTVSGLAATPRGGCTIPA